MKVSGEGYSFANKHQDRVRLLKEVSSLKEIRSALSFLGFLSPFVPSLSIKLAEFGGFRKKGASFLDWNSDYQGRWERMLEGISNEDLVGYYDPDSREELRVLVDASEKGWGGDRLPRQPPSHRHFKWIF